MITTVTTERETVWMSCETGEVVESHREAMELYRAGHEIKIQYRYRYNGGEWEPWQEGPQWVH